MMTFRSLHVRWLPWAFLGIVPSLASGGPIGFNTWYQFSFTDPGVQAAGCQPNDPSGLFCIPSSAGNSTFLDAPPWTINVNGTAAAIRVTDTFFSGDIFVVFDNGSPLGTTSVVPANGHDCGSNPVVCFADPAMSHATFPLVPGVNSITIESVASPSIAGSADLEVVPLVPEPGVLGLLVVGVLFIAACAPNVITGATGSLPGSVRAGLPSRWWRAALRLLFRRRAQTS
jgi:hypothetical protein